MPRVDFYILQDENPLSLQQFACRLAAKAYQQGQRILIQTENAEQSHVLDDMLWTFDVHHFLHHATHTAASNDDQAIVIHHDTVPLEKFQTMINLSSITPVDTSHFNRIAEILNQQETRKQTGREHYKMYKARGYELYHHEIQ